MTTKFNSGVLAEEDMPRHWPLKSEAEIIASWKDDISQPVVSVCCSTYNHGNFLRDAIHGFLTQKTDFPFEIIIRDDASDDGTTEIVLDYARRYPKIVHTLINESNRFKLGERAAHVWPSVAKGKYIALCEGDDFWIAPNKLQKQVDLLEKHRNAVMCVAKTYVCEQNERGSLVYSHTTNPLDKDLLTFDDVHSSYVHTSTYLIRTVEFKEVINKYFSGHCMFGDTALRAILISYGPFALLNDVVSVYRISGSGIWTSLNREQQLQWEFDAAEKLANMLPGRYGSYEKARLARIAFEQFCYFTRQRYWSRSIRYFPLALQFIAGKIFTVLWQKLKAQEHNADSK